MFQVVLKPGIDGKGDVHRRKTQGKIQERLNIKAKINNVEKRDHVVKSINVIKETSSSTMNKKGKKETLHEKRQNHITLTQPLLRPDIIQMEENQSKISKKKPKHDFMKKYEGLVSSFVPPKHGEIQFYRTCIALFRLIKWER